MRFQEGITQMAENSILCVDLTAVHHDALHRAVDLSTLCFEFIANIGSHCCFSSTGHAVQGHVGWNVSIQRLDKVETQFLDFILSVRENFWAEVVTKDFLVNEQSFS